MKKICPNLLIFFLILMSGNIHLYASRTEFDTDQVCSIEGIIRSVRYEEAFRDACLDDDSCPVGAYSPDRPERYYLEILLNSRTCYPEKDDNSFTYQGQFKVGEEVEVYIDKSEVRAGESFASGQRIGGQVKYRLGHFFVSYELK